MPRRGLLSCSPLPLMLPATIVPLSFFSYPYMYLASKYEGPIAPSGYQQDPWLPNQCLKPGETHSATGIQTARYKRARGFTGRFAFQTALHFSCHQYSIFVLHPSSCRPRRCRWDGKRPAASSSRPSRSPTAYGSVSCLTTDAVVEPVSRQRQRQSRPRAVDGQSQEARGRGVVTARRRQDRAFGTRLDAVVLRLYAIYRRRMGTSSTTAGPACVSSPRHRRTSTSCRKNSSNRS